METGFKTTELPFKICMTLDLPSNLLPHCFEAGRIFHGMLNVGICAGGWLVCACGEGRVHI